MRLFNKLLKAGEGKKQRALASLVPDVNALEPEIQRLSDEDLRAKTAELRKFVQDSVAGDSPSNGGPSNGDEGAPLDPADFSTAKELREAQDELRHERRHREERRIQKSEDALNEVLIEAFAVTREASVRAIGQRHYDVQLMGGAGLHFGWIAEMKTGEGKTLVSTLPVYLNSLAGRGVHIVTVNDYLAKRDAEMMGRIHKWLGLSVGIALPGMTFADKKAAYDADLTYGTNTEFGFDYLRDNMARSRSEMLQRTHHFAIVDEVDSILIDEARTPLIISGPSAESARLYNQFAGIVRQLRRDVDYEVDEEKRTVTPTEEGIERVEKGLGVENLYDVSAVSYVHQLTQALRAKELYHRDKEYIIADNEVKIVDEFTGRVLEGRRWSDGLHQAVEAKERVKIQEENHTWATVTLQDYFRMYHKLAGMTGTAETEAGEFAGTYAMPVVPVPTHRPMVRDDESDVVYKTEISKFNAIVDDIVERNIEGQPVLVGTASVDRSELLSKMLRQRGVKHEVLNAKQHTREAEIVAQAGRIGGVTVATNMAGRGVDILLGGNPEGLARQEVAAQGVELHTDEGRALYDSVLPKFVEQCKREADEVREVGGLYVLGSERHESRRIDNQLRGRAGRQGDPGESRFFLSLQDELMRLFAAGAMSWVMDRALPEDTPIEAKMVSRAIERAQNMVEARNGEIRKDVVKYGEVLNEQRKVIYARRIQVIDGEDLRAHTLELLHDAIEGIIDTYISDDVEDWEPRKLLNEVLQFYPSGLSAGDIENIESADELVEIFTSDVDTFYEKKEIEMPGGIGTMRSLEREVMLRIIDARWREHLAEMDYLRDGINLRAMGQQDPLVAWKREGFELFGKLISAIDHDYLRMVTHVEAIVEEPKSAPAQNELAGAQYIAPDGPVQRPGAVASPPGPVGAPSTPSQVPDDVMRTVVKSEEQRVGRNDPCWCGSGKKFKNCHGV